MTTFWQLTVRWLDVMSPVLIGIASMLLMDGLRLLWGWLDRQGPWAKRCAILVLNFYLTLFVQWTDTKIAPDVTLLTPGTADILLSTVLSMLLHGERKRERATREAP